MSYLGWAIFGALMVALALAYVSINCVHLFATFCSVAVN
jgi:hypothetical protein